MTSEELMGIISMSLGSWFIAQELVNFLQKRGLMASTERIGRCVLAGGGMFKVYAFVGVSAMGYALLHLA